MIVGVLLLGIGIVYWFLVAPRYSQIKRLEPYKSVYIAHRGLHDNQSNAPENTMMAFHKAVQRGYGIELDVQLTKDRQVVVIHDRELRRVTNGSGRVQEYTYDELQQFQVFGTEETIPLFSDVLQLVVGKVPIIVEIKAGADYKELCSRAGQLLDTYQGEFCVESFSPLAVRWFRTHYPQWIRGQLSTNYKKDGLSKSWYANVFLGGFLLNFLGRPDFLAYNHKYADGWQFRLASLAAGKRLVAWTIKSQEQLEKAKLKFQSFIFDSFIPKD